MPTTKPTVGRLIQVQPNGPAKVLAENKPFPALQELKKEYVRYGFNKDNLKITY